MGARLAGQCQKCVVARVACQVDDDVDLVAADGCSLFGGRAAGQVDEVIDMALHPLRDGITTRVQEEGEHFELPAIELGQQAFDKIHHRVVAQIGETTRFSGASRRAVTLGKAGPVRLLRCLEHGGKLAGRLVQVAGVALRIGQHEQQLVGVVAGVVGLQRDGRVAVLYCFAYLAQFAPLNGALHQRNHAFFVVACQYGSLLAGVKPFVVLAQK